MKEHAKLWKDARGGAGKKFGEGLQGVRKRDSCNISCRRESRRFCAAPRSSLELQEGFFWDSPRTLTFVMKHKEMLCGSQTSSSVEISSEISCSLFPPPPLFLIGCKRWGPHWRLARHWLVGCRSHPTPGSVSDSRAAPLLLLTAAQSLERRRGAEQTVRAWLTVCGPNRCSAHPTLQASREQARLSASAGHFSLMKANTGETCGSIPWNRTASRWCVFCWQCGQRWELHDDASWRQVACSPCGLQRVTCLFQHILLFFNFQNVKMSWEDKRKCMHAHCALLHAA